jgi:transposase-like protein
MSLGQTAPRQRLAVKEVCELLQVHQSTLRNWSRRERYAGSEPALSSDPDALDIN